MKKSRKSSQMQNRIMSVDPGFDRAGVALMEKSGGKEKVIFSECILTNKKDQREIRLKQIGLRIKALIEKYEPKALAIEKLFFNANTTSAIGVAEARGVIMYEATLAKIKVFEYSPQEIKIAVTSYGKASKSDVTFMVEKLVSMPPGKRLDDELDAVALGLTHLSTVRYK